MEKRKVLICPLNWGLGHAARCIPIALELHNQGHQIILASSGEAYTFLNKELPQFKLDSLPDYQIKYWKSLPIWLSVLIQLPKLLFKIREEHKALKDIVFKNNIDVVISDNRLGAYHDSISSIYISHQVQIKSPLGSFLNPATLLHQYFMRSFDQIWIPDVAEEEHSLAGKLSHPKKPLKNSTYIGWLSRLKAPLNHSEERTVLVLLSGIEPHRTKLEQEILDQINELTDYQFVVLGGKLNKTEEEKNLPKHISYVSFASSDRLQNEIKQARLIICRSGYSSLMDILHFNKRLLLVPSPGQTEQEYLARRLDGTTLSTSQRALDLKEQIPMALSGPRFSLPNLEQNTSSIIKL